MKDRAAMTINPTRPGVYKQVLGPVRRGVLLRVIKRKGVSTMKTWLSAFLSALAVGVLKGFSDSFTAF